MALIDTCGEEGIALKVNRLTVIDR